MNKFNDAGEGKNIFVVLCGRMTPSQRTTIRNKSQLNSELFLHLLNWFIKVTQMLHLVLSVLIQ